MYDCYLLENEILEIKYFIEHLGELERRYTGKFIAIHEDNVIDSDEDESKLSSRVNNIIDALGPVVIVNPGKRVRFLRNVFNQTPNSN